MVGVSAGSEGVGNVGINYIDARHRQVSIFREVGDDFIKLRRSCLGYFASIITF